MYNKIFTHPKFHKLLKWFAGILIGIMVLSTPLWLLPLAFLEPSGGSGFEIGYLGGFFIVLLSLILTFLKSRYIFGILFGGMMILCSLWYDEQYWHDYNTKRCHEYPEDLSCRDVADLNIDLLFPPTPENSGGSLIK